MPSGAPYGYQYVRKSEHADARYDVVEHQAAVVREVFRRYVEDDESIAGLCRWLESSDVPTRSGKTRWDRATVWGMLRNPAYAGRAAFGKTARSHDDRPALNRTGRLAGRAGTLDQPHNPRAQPRRVDRGGGPRHHRRDRLRAGRAEAGRQQTLRGA
ncbi:MAG: recombinase family protein [Egibacteraceae bacterium]